MINIDNNIIDKNLVHKDYKKNVFISNLRRKVPNFIQESIFEDILKKVNINEKKILLENFVIISSDDTIFLKSEEKKHYKLKSIIINLETSIFEDKIQNPTDLDFMNNLYKFNDNIKKYSLIQDVSEEEEKQILSIIKKKSIIIPDEIKFKISKILENFDKIPKSEIVYANMHVNLNHDFFFEHHNDHVPGVMLIETFRQFGVALCHIYGKVPEHDAQMCLDFLESNFLNYAELSLPIILKGIIKETQWNKQEYWSFFDFETYLYQSNKKIGYFHLKAQMIPKNVFNRIRRKKIKEIIEPYRFLPYPDIFNHFAIKNTITNKYIQAKLENISNNGFMLKSTNFKELNIENNPFNFYLYINDIGFINGICEKRWQNQVNGEAGFQITDIVNDDCQNLKNYILKYCFVNEKREIF